MPVRKYVVTDKVTEAIVSVCMFKHAGKPDGYGLELRRTTGKLVFSVESTSVSAETLSRAAKIVFMYMTQIEKGSLSFALTLAEGGEETKTDSFAKKASHFLNHGVTVNEAQSIMRIDKASEPACSGTTNEVQRAQNMLHVGRHIRAMSRQSFQVAT